MLIFDKIADKTKIKSKIHFINDLNYNTPIYDVYFCSNIRGSNYISLDGNTKEINEYSSNINATENEIKKCSLFFSNMILKLTSLSEFSNNNLLKDFIKEKCCYFTLKCLNNNL